MNFDVIVIGTGGVGSAALYDLARQGVKVLGIDRFPPAHDKGSSHGETRIIRKSYFEHPNYVPLLNSAYSLWDEISEQSNHQLINRNGLLYLGNPNGAVLQGVSSSAKQHKLEIEHLTAADAAKRFPGFTASGKHVAVFEPEAGYLLVEECIRTYLQKAVALGAQHRFGESVLNWTANDRNVTVETDKGRYHADKLIITGGCWAGSLLTELGIPLQIVRKHLHWHTINTPVYRLDKGCPCFFIEAGEGYFYGFPDIAGSGLKVAEHTGGTYITDPLVDDRQPDASDSQNIRTFIQNHLPGVSRTRQRHSVCFYTSTPDAHFVVDRHPEHDSVVFAAGLSGHGFKFAAVLGRILTELTLHGATQFDIDFLSAGRESLRRA